MVQVHSFAERKTVLTAQHMKRSVRQGQHRPICRRSLSHTLLGSVTLADPPAGHPRECAHAAAANRANYPSTASSSR